mmetsp:Transcript_33235/g.80348  ORF Transcript_33235/g.80348 Transcript_33235/m.80348 type:complete len:254 (+) Transcript_33235:90-851(+)
MKTLELPQTFSMMGDDLKKETDHTLMSCTDDTSDDDFDDDDDDVFAITMPDVPIPRDDDLLLDVSAITMLDYDDDDDDASAITMPDVLYYRDIFRRRGSPPPRDTKVRFHSVEVREYPIILGDNPSCNIGPPLTIGWEPNSVLGKITPLDDFENLRSRQRRNHLQELKLPSAHRNDMLKKLGFSEREIQKASAQASKVRKQRIATFQKDQRMASLRQWKGRTLEFMPFWKTTNDSTNKTCCESVAWRGIVATF